MFEFCNWSVLLVESKIFLNPCSDLLDAKTTIECDERKIIKYLYTGCGIKMNWFAMLIFIFFEHLFFMKHRFMEIKRNWFFSITLKIVLSQAGIKKGSLFLYLIISILKELLVSLVIIKCPKAISLFYFVSIRYTFLLLLLLVSCTTFIHEIRDEFGIKDGFKWIRTQTKTKIIVIIILSRIGRRIKSVTYLYLIWRG